MILYFSGTGNSAYLAERLQENLGDLAFNAAEILRKQSVLVAAQDTLEVEVPNRLILVFPVYAWDAPTLFYGALMALKIPKNTYIYAVAVCGENVGNTFSRLNKYLKRVGCKLAAGRSVVSPNNYIVVGKVDVDRGDRLEMLLHKMEDALPHIVKEVQDLHMGIEAIKGPMPLVTSGLVNPLFNRFGRSDKAYSVEDSCTHCGLCEKVCPVGNIGFNHANRNPYWRGHCLMCTACLHTCPVQAIQYGKVTLSKGRYFNPKLDRKYVALYNNEEDNRL